MKVQGKSVLVLPDVNPEKINGVIVPKTADKINDEGHVVDCGEGCDNVSIGDKVKYSPKNSSIVRINDVVHHFVAENIGIFYVYGKEDS